MNEIATVNQDRNFSVTLDVNSTVDTWLVKTVRADAARANDIKNDKSKAVLSFFDWSQKSPEEVFPSDVQAWLESLDEAGLALGTRYNRVSALSNYFEYLRNDVGLNKQIPINPALVSRFKAPEPFNSKTVTALSSDQLYRLMAVVENHAQTNDPSYLRDYAILQFFIVTGRRREEIMQLHGSDIEINDDGFYIRPKVKGGHYRSFEIDDSAAQDALYKYLEATNRGPEIFGRDEPLWLRHGVGGKLVTIKVKGKVKISNKLSSHGFEKRIKAYAVEAGIRGFHIHKLRHTFAQIVAKSTGSLADTQEALDHSNIKTTKVYVKRLEVVKDKSSSFIRNTLKTASERKNSKDK